MIDPAGRHRLPSLRTDSPPVPHRVRSRLRRVNRFKSTAVTHVFGRKLREELSLSLLKRYTTIANRIADVEWDALLKGERMPIYMTSSPDISSINGYSAVGEVRAGGNGDPYGSPEYDVGDGSTFTEGRTTWTNDVSNGFDTGWVSVELDVRAGGVTWNVANSTSGELTYDDASYGTIGSVELRAAVQNSDMQCEWGNLAVSFYKGGALQETMSTTDLVEADTFNSSSSTAETDCTFVPTNSDSDEVIITGRVRMDCSDAYIQPTDNDIFGQIFAFPS